MSYHIFELNRLYFLRALRLWYIHFLIVIGAKELQGGQQVHRPKDSSCLNCINLRSCLSFLPHSIPKKQVVVDWMCDWLHYLRYPLLLNREIRREGLLLYLQITSCKFHNQYTSKYFNLLMTISLTLSNVIIVLSDNLLID